MSPHSKCHKMTHNLPGRPVSSRWLPTYLSFNPILYFPGHIPRQLMVLSPRQIVRVVLSVASRSSNADVMQLQITLPVTLTLQKDIPCALYVSALASIKVKMAVIPFQEVRPGPLAQRVVPLHRVWKPTWMKTNTEVLNCILAVPQNPLFP